MTWKQKEFHEVTKALEDSSKERPAKGNLAPIASLGIKKLIKLFEEKARTAPEYLPEAPWERNTSGAPKCDCGECDGSGWIYMEGRGVRFCGRPSSRSSQLRGRSEGGLGRDRLDLSAIFKRRG